MGIGIVPFRKNRKINFFRDAASRELEVSDVDVAVDVRTADPRHFLGQGNF
jgi:hypothetical protein